LDIGIDAFYISRRVIIKITAAYLFLGLFNAAADLEQFCCNATIRGASNRPFYTALMST
jgi:hypothetical protein